MPCGVLVDEAEDAVAGAGLELHGREAAGDRVDVRRVHLDQHGLARPALDVRVVTLVLGRVVVEVEDVLEGPAVEVGDVVAGLPLVQLVQRCREMV